MAIELEQAANNVCSAANDSTGLMAEIIDGKRSLTMRQRG